ncbi:cucumber peeling cupredoxin-like [Prosopis cineraria]|uniref:cucumber peeling cupredoxin-like n=1 Tax=Prosopis cineraria TaxID=364024 RepID=UPI0024101267|nr:cucumber peeling cupredoxin-like [Prosopis cineraria]
MVSPTTAAIVTVFVLFISAAAAATVYTNHTVGGANGWFFNATTNTSAANYSAWAASQTFNLGDYLIFNTNSNQTVIQTYNLTTYQNCTADESDNGTFVYNGGASRFGEALDIAVPLTIEGPNYYFSDAGDGVQCQQGMAFEINVKHGQGLPPSLNQPPPPPYIEPPGPNTADSPPITVAQSPNNAFTAQANVRQVFCGLCAALLFFLFH